MESSARSRRLSPCGAFHRRVPIMGGWDAAPAARPGALPHPLVRRRQRRASFELRQRDHDSAADAVLSPAGAGARYFTIRPVGGDGFDRARRALAVYRLLVRPDRRAIAL